jgi:hypothetical protein
VTRPAESREDARWITRTRLWYWLMRKAYLRGYKDAMQIAQEVVRAKSQSHQG